MPLRTAQIDSKWPCYLLLLYEPQKVLKLLIDILMGYSIVLMNQFVWAYPSKIIYFFFNNFMADVRLIVRSDVLRRK